MLERIAPVAQSVRVGDDPLTTEQLHKVIHSSRQGPLGYCRRNDRGHGNSSSQNPGVKPTLTPVTSSVYETRAGGAVDSRTTSLVSSWMWSASIRWFWSWRTSRFTAIRPISASG